MIIYDVTWLKPSVARDRLRVARMGTWDGRVPGGRYFEKCRAFHRPTGTVMMLSRDVGAHTSGWYKNPEYERCLHLSLSFRDPTSGQLAPRDKALTREWVRLIFGDDASKLWCEPPRSPEGRSLEVWHYRLFCATGWRPIIPRGEVYSRELTEAGWKSYSDVRAEMAEQERIAMDRHGQNMMII
jgi:hypothetical protein